MSKIVVIGQEPQIVNALSRHLRREGYAVSTATRGQEGLDQVAIANPDLILLDLDPPDLSGVDVLRRLRVWSDVPVIGIAPCGAEHLALSALDGGADDVVQKPLSMDQLLARVRSGLRRARADGSNQARFDFGALHVDLTARKVQLGGRLVHFTPTEFRLLEAFVTHPDKLLSHWWLLERAWGRGYGDEGRRSLRLYVGQLRSKIGDEAETPRFIQTESGVGYRWIAQATGDVVAEVQSEGRLTALRDLKILDTPPEEAFDRFTRLASRLLGVPVSLVSLVDRDRQFFKSQTGVSEPWASRRETPLSHSFCQYAVAGREPLLVEDATSDPRFCGNLAIRDLSVVAYCGIPLISSSGEAVGSLCAIDSKPRVWSEEDVQLLKDLAASVVAEMDLRTAASKLAQTEEEEVTKFAQKVRQPVAGMLGATRILRRRGERLTGAQREEFLELIEQHADHLFELVEGLEMADPQRVPS